MEGFDERGGLTAEDAEGGVGGVVDGAEGLVERIVLVGGALEGGAGGARAGGFVIDGGRLRR